MDRTRLRSLVLRTALSLLALVILMLGAAWAFLPGWVQSSGAKLASEAIGRQVRIEQVRFQPWRLGLVLEGVSIAGAQGEQQPLLKLGSLDAALSLRSLWHFSPVLSSLSIDKPVVHLARTADGHYDLDDLIARFSKPAPKAGKSNQPDFALYNIRLSGGEIRFDDQPVRHQHLVSDLSFELPFISTLDTDEKVEVLPRLSGKFNGVAFGGTGEALPFAEPPEASLDVKLARLDLAPYLPYVPKGLPLQLTKGAIEAQIKLHFAKAQVRISGQLGLSDFALQTPAGEPFAAWKDLQIGLKDVRPLHHRIQLGAVRWDGLELAAGRDAAGRLLMPGLPDSKPDSKAETKPDTAAAWTAGLESFALNKASLHWRDAATRPKAELQMEALDFNVGALQWPLKGATPLKYALKLQGADFSGEGSLSAEQLQLALGWQGLPLAGFAPYVPASAPLRLQGMAQGKLELKLTQPMAPDASARMQLALKDWRVQDFAISTAPNEPLASLGALALDEALLDLGAQQMHLGTLSLNKPVLQLVRSKEGQWRHAVLLGTGATPPAASAAPAGKPWSVDLSALALDGGAVHLRDASLGDEDGLAIDLDTLKLQMNQIAWPAVKPMPATLSFSVGSPQARASARGSVQWQGQVSLAPLGASGKLRVVSLPLQLGNELLNPAWGLRLRRAELGWRGSFEAQQQATGWLAKAQGDLLLADLRVAQQSLVDGKPVTGDNLLSWQALNLDGLQLSLQPGSAPSVNIAQARLEDFYASLLVNEQGKLNLQTLGPQEVASAPAASASAASSPAQPLRIAVQSTQLNKGKVDFTDHFVKPNYSAQLSDLVGSLGAFASDKPATAPLKLQGRVAGTGVLDISGQINPGASSPVMDVTAAGTDIELAPLSPYSGKYAGYAIERGKLSARVHYKIEPGGALQAENQLTLNQLSFGDAVDSPDATRLPVRLAVALLKDRDGVIDINLPVSGSINDPEFSFGGLIFKAIINLIGKAVTSPFSLFSGSGGQDLSQIAFAPGSPSPSDTAPIEKVAKMLNERPALKLTITGSADLAREREALQQRSLDEAIANEARRELRRKQTATADAKAQQAPELSEADRARLLKLVYANAKLPDKPRNLIGLEKDIPAEQMRALLLPSYPVDAQRIHDLALQRSVGLRDALIAQGVPNSRIFLAAPHVGGADLPADWQPRAELALGTD